MRTVVLLLILFSLNCQPDAEISRTDPNPFAVELDPMPSFRRDYWPTRGWQERLLPKDRWEALEDYAFRRQGDEEDRAGIRTDGVVIIKDGYLIYERYAAGYDSNSPHLTWSVSKSVL
ncbi:MAG TPA: penicillin-binding protein, partial [Leptospiraceae bacterium]|nr:penicillin-binding protein [Leptospiraceae bacterium]